MRAPADVSRIFLALILAQAAHSIEEYTFHLYDVLAPARIVARAVSSILSGDLAAGFAVANVFFVVAGLWCYFAWVRSDHRWARGVAWFWVIVETSNGLGHLLFAARAGGYFPGVATAPVLLVLAGWLGVRLAATPRAPGRFDRAA